MAPLSPFVFVLLLLAVGAMLAALWRVLLPASRRLAWSTTHHRYQARRWD